MYKLISQMMFGKPKHGENIINKIPTCTRTEAQNQPPYEQWEIEVGASKPFAVRTLMTDNAHVMKVLQLHASTKSVSRTY